jgi:DNA-binding LacI/PurR family transcriptional regulator
VTPQCVSEACEVIDRRVTAAGAELLAARPRPTAILAASDALALGALAAATELGLRVPDQLSIVGFDDIPAALTAGLTTVHQPAHDKGRLAARLLHDPDTDTARQHLLPTELIQRTTTAPPPP